MALNKWVTGTLVVVSLQVLAAYALGGYPGTFYHIMMRLNKDRKNPRTAPSPNQLWAILDPPASLGSLGGSPYYTNRIVRSVEDEAREEEYARDAETETTTEPAQEESETESPEAETEAPVTTEAPFTCGGDLNITVDPHKVDSIIDGQIMNEIIESPGWEEGEYPEDVECTWNINVGNDCLMGMMIFTVLEGHIRETLRCQDDYLMVTQNSGIHSKYCGPVVSGNYRVSGTDIWTLESELPRTTQLMFKSGMRDGVSSGGQPKGFKIEVISYCWAFTQDFLSRTTTTAAPGEEEASDNEVMEEEEEVTTTVAPENQNVKIIGEDFISNSETNEEETQGETNSLLGDGVDIGSPDILIPSGVLPSVPESPIAPVVASAGIDGNDAGSPDDLLPSDPAQSVPVVPIASVVPVDPVPTTNGGGGGEGEAERPSFIPIIPLRVATATNDNEDSRLDNVTTVPIVIQLLREETKN